MKKEEKKDRRKKERQKKEWSKERRKKEEDRMVRYLVDDRKRSFAITGADLHTERLKTKNRLKIRRRILR